MSAKVEHERGQVEADSVSPASELAPEAQRGEALGRSSLGALGRVPTVRALGWFLLLAAIPYAHPKLRRLRLVHAPWDATPETIVADGATGPKAEYGEVVIGESKTNAPTEAQGPENPTAALPAMPAAAAKGSASAAPPLPILEVAQNAGAGYRAVEDPSGHALDHFIASLAKTERGAPGAITRVVHYGDSLLVSDFMSSTLRRRFQQRFGDAGHGFVLFAKPWDWYFHQDVSTWAKEGWHVHRIVNPRIGDEMYGLGGVTFRTTDALTATFGTAKPVPGEPVNEKQAFGRRVGRFDIHYLEQPDGGSFDVSIDGKKVDTVKTRGAAKKLAIASFDVDDGPHELSVHTWGGAEARFFGVALERKTPGVVWDALGVNGSRARLLDVNQLEHWTESLRSRDPALVILQFGTNESADTGYPMDQYEASLRKVLQHVHDAVPTASCMLVGPMDRAGSGAGGMDSLPIIAQLRDSQRKVAFEVGCAFWDTREAMGGKGAMGRWVKSNPHLGGGDLTHPTALGAAVLGDLLYTALAQAYDARSSAP